MYAVLCEKPDKAANLRPGVRQRMRTGVHEALLPDSASSRARHSRARSWNPSDDVQGEREEESYKRGQVESRMEL